MIKKILLGLSLIIILGISFKISQSRSLSMHFVDEEDHIAFADYINQGYQLHADLQNNHQPLIYFGSAALQKITQPENIFMLIRRHRQVMFFYGAIWSLLLVLRFKTVGLITVLFLEFLKYYLFGNLWLMESLAVYPVIYIMADFIKTLFKKCLPKTKKLLILGFLSFIVIFTLVPLWPWLALIWFIWLFKLKKKIIWPALGLIIPTLILFSINYSPIDWFRETIYRNFVYAIPELSPIKQTTDYLKLIFFPFLSYFDLGSLQAKFIALFFSGFLIAGVKKPKLFWLYPLLMLANNRVLSPGEVYYQGFHLLPWLGLMILIFSFSYQYLQKPFKLIFLILAGILLLDKNMPYRIKTDQANEYYINFSTVEDANEAIKAIIQPQDRLAVLYNQPLVYWQTQAIPATRQLVYYAWEPKIKELNDRYEQVFHGPNPPEIIYGDKEATLLASQYTNLKREGVNSMLYIRNDRYQQISTSQWEKLIYRGFSR